MSKLTPMTKKNEGGGSLKPKGKPAPNSKKNTNGIKLGTSIKTETVTKLNANFVTWDDLKDNQSIVFELNGEFKTTTSEQNKNWKFENYYTWKVVVVDADENVLRVIEAKDSESLIQVPCQQSQRQGIKDLIEMNENVAIYKEMSTNTKDGTTYYNCNVGSLDLESLDAFEVE